MWLESCTTVSTLCSRGVALWTETESTGRSFSRTKRGTLGRTIRSFVDTIVVSIMAWRMELSWTKPSRRHDVMVSGIRNEIWKALSLSAVIEGKKNPASPNDVRNSWLKSSIRPESMPESASYDASEPSNLSDVSSVPMTAASVMTASAAAIFASDTNPLTRGMASETWPTAFLLIIPAADR